MLNIAMKYLELYFSLSLAKSEMHQIGVWNLIKLQQVYMGA